MSLEYQIRKLIAVNKPEPTPLYSIAPIDEQKGGLLPAGEPWEWGDNSPPGRFCKTCQTTSPPQFCSCIRAWHGGVFLIEPEDVNNPSERYYNYDPNFVPPTGWKRAMEWPAGCPSLSQMMAPAFTNQAEWEAARTSWITRIADALIAGNSGDYSVKGAASILTNICRVNWRPCSTNYVMSAIFQCVINRRGGLPCTGEMFDGWWSSDWQGLPDVPYYAKFLMDNGCIGNSLSGSSCTPGPIGEGNICVDNQPAGSPGYSVQNCFDRGNTNCVTGLGGLAPNFITNENELKMPANEEQKKAAGELIKQLKLFTKKTKNEKFNR